MPALQILLQMLQSPLMSTASVSQTPEGPLKVWTQRILGVHMPRNHGPENYLDGLSDYSQPPTCGPDVPPVELVTVLPPAAPRPLHLAGESKVLAPEPLELVE